MRNNHVKVMITYIENKMNFGECIITHKDILRETNANCCYSVLKSLRKYYNITDEWIEKENCKYKKYKIKRKEIINVQKTDIWRKSENVQLSLI